MSATVPRYVKVQHGVVCLSVGLRGHDVDPDVAGHCIGLVATLGHRKGEQYLSRVGRVYTRPTGQWTYRCDGNDVEDVMQSFLSHVEPRSSVIREVAIEMRAELSVSLWWDPPARHGGFCLPAPTLRRFLALGDQCHFYFPG